MKVFVTGVNGQLGYDVVLELARRGYFCWGSGSAPAYTGIEGQMLSHAMTYVQADITDEAQISRVLEDLRPDAVIHCAAWTNVDGAEDEENIPKVFAINESGTRNLAECCRKLDCKMVYISTDYVFDGQGEEPWKPDCRDYLPLNVYGRSKLAGEMAVASLVEKHFIVRTAWVFGSNGKNFVKTMLNVGQKFKSLRVVNDQIGTPTYTRDLARLLTDMVETERYGCYHATNEGGYISWYDFACEIFRQAGYDTQVVSVTTEEYGLSRAIRPFNSRLCKQKLSEAGFARLPHWKDALERYLSDMSTR